MGHILWPVTHHSGDLWPAWPVPQSQTMANGMSRSRLLTNHDEFSTIAFSSQQWCAIWNSGIPFDPDPLTHCLLCLQQHRQSVSHLRSVPSYFPRICYLPLFKKHTRNTLLTKTNSQNTVQSSTSLSYGIQNNRTSPPRSYASESSSQSSSVCLLQASLNWNSPIVYPWSSHAIGIGSYKFSCLCLAAAFDTIDYNIPNHGERSVIKPTFHHGLEFNMLCLRLV